MPSSRFHKGFTNFPHTYTHTWLGPTCYSKAAKRGKQAITHPSRWSELMNVPNIKYERLFSAEKILYFVCVRQNRICLDQVENKCHKRAKLTPTHSHYKEVYTIEHKEIYTHYVGASFTWVTCVCVPKVLGTLEDAHKRINLCVECNNTFVF